MEFFPVFCCFGSAQIEGFEAGGVGEFAGFCFFSADRIYGAGATGPVISIQEAYAGRVEGIFVIYESFAQEPYRIIRLDKTGEEIGGGNQAIRCYFLPVAVGVFIQAHVKLFAFCIDNSSQAGNFYVFVADIRRCVDSEDVHSVCGNNFCAGRKGHHLCHCNGDSQAGEAAGTRGDIDMSDFFNLSVDALQEGAGRGKKLRTVRHQT